MASDAETYLKAVHPPVAINLPYSQHSDTLELTVKVKSLSTTWLDMQVFQEKSGKEDLLFDVKGKKWTFSKQVTITDSDHKEVYFLQQRKAKLPYSFWAIARNHLEAAENASSTRNSIAFNDDKKDGVEDEDVGDVEPGEHEEKVFAALAKGGWSKDLLDLESVTFPDSEGAQKRFSLKTGPLKTVSDITDSDGSVVGQIIRSDSNMQKIWNPAENYRLRIAPGVDSSLILLITICLHIQLVNYKMGSIW